jgi:hypothetical protein
VKNLFIVDGGIFVISAGVNPTPTIQALALYVADSIEQRLATLFDRDERGARSRVGGSSKLLSSPVGKRTGPSRSTGGMPEDGCSTVSDSRGPCGVRNGW